VRREKEKKGRRISRRPCFFLLLSRNASPYKKKGGRRNGGEGEGEGREFQHLCITVMRERKRGKKNVKARKYVGGGVGGKIDAPSPLYSAFLERKKIGKGGPKKTGLRGKKKEKNPPPPPMQ